MCGLDGQCRVQLVVEADGSAYPCDFYCLDEYRLGNLCEKTIPELLAAPQAETFLQRPRESPALCARCEFRRSRRLLQADAARGLLHQEMAASAAIGNF